MTVAAKPLPVNLHIGGKQISHGSAGVFKHVYSHSGEVQAEIPLAGPEQMNEAVEAAAKAFQEWRRWKPADRRDILLALGNLIESKAEDFGRLVSLDNGTPIALSSLQAKGSKAWIAYYAGWADKLEGGVTSTFMQGRDFSYTLPEPYGVIGAIIPFNGPMNSLAMKAGPALASGNTVVIKPSELAPFSAELFARCVREAGIPDGVCNIVPGGAEAGEALVKHPKVEKISFTGGPAAAKRILQSCAENLKPALLELGGKSANLVFPDADLKLAAEHATTWSLAVLSGQGCAFPTRLLVHADIYEEMVERTVALAEELAMGDPFDPRMVMGPVINAAAAERILASIARAKKAGDGRLVTGGGRPGGSLSHGSYVEPTIFSDVKPRSELAQQEVFGPVLSILRFETEEEAVQIANATSYGLAAFVHTRDLDRTHRVAGELRAGGIFVNGATLVEPDTAFGGLGLSGYGREGGRFGIEEYIRPKTVAIAQSSRG
jgi:aldehyde dehydrogenase (NAD+)